MNQTHQNLDLSWDFEDLKLYDNQSSPIVATIFTLIAGVTLVLGGIVHRAIFKLLKRIPDRPINIIIFPSLVNIAFYYKIKILIITFHSITTCTSKLPVSTPFCLNSFSQKETSLMHVLVNFVDFCNIQKYTDTYGYTIH